MTAKQDGSNEPDISTGPLREFVDGTVYEATTLGEIRERIDSVDARIVSALAERAELVRNAAIFKKNDLEVTALGRQLEVIDRVRQLAEGSDVRLGGFTPLVVEVYGVIVPGFVELQRDALKGTRPIRGKEF